MSASRELIQLYWDIGEGIVERQKKEGWGKSVVEKLSNDLRKEFPDIGGFSTQNIWRMRAFYLAWNAGKRQLSATGSIVARVARELSSKGRFNQGEQSNVYFWRDKNGHEIDCLIEQVAGSAVIEIKSSKTVTEDFFDNLQYYQKLSGIETKNSFVVYGGDQKQSRSFGKVIPWNQLGSGLIEEHGL